MSDTRSTGQGFALSPDPIISGAANTGFTRDSASPALEVIVSSRTRSIWLYQLGLAIAVAITFLLTLFVRPEQFALWEFSIGISTIFLLTVVAITVPWDRTPPGAALFLPLADIAAIGAMTLRTDMQLAYLWMFPIAWIALHFTLEWMLGSWAFITLLLIGVSSSQGLAEVLLRFSAVLLPIGFVGVMLHLSARRTRAYRLLLGKQASRLQTSLQRVTGQERSSAEMLNGIEVGVVRIDHEGQLLAVNDTYASMYGLTVEDTSMPGTSIEYDAPQGTPIPSTETSLSRARRGEIFTDATVWIFDRYDEWRCISVSAHPLVSELGERHTLLVAHDVTMLAKTNTAHERVTAIVSHELRNPATAVLGHAELALEDDTLKAETRERIETVVSAAERMLTLSSSILEQSEVSSATESVSEAYDLRPLLDASLDLFAANAAENSISLRLSAPESIPMTGGNSFRLRQALDNLISNAVKYSHAAGSVRVSAQIDVDFATVTIADNGIGMSQDDVVHIFDPYFRTPQARTHAPGTGLGMQISREIVQLHGGTMEVESKVDIGTTVRIRLPRNREGAEA